MGGLQVGVGLVLRMALPVVRQRHRLRTDVVTHPVPTPPCGMLVLIVTKVHDEIRLLLGEAPVRGEPPLLEVRARCDAHRQRVQRARRGCGAGATRRGQVPACTEPVEVLRAGAQSTEFDVHAVRRLGRRPGHPALLDAGERLVARHLPADVDRPGGHATTAVAGERVGRQPGPYHHPVRGRFARGHAERERIQGHGTAARTEAHHGGGGQERRALEQRATGGAPAGTGTLQGHGRVSAGQLSGR